MKKLMKARMDLFVQMNRLELLAKRVEDQMKIRFLKKLKIPVDRMVRLRDRRTKQTQWVLVLGVFVRVSMTGQEITYWVSVRDITKKGEQRSMTHQIKNLRDRYIIEKEQFPAFVEV